MEHWSPAYNWTKAQLVRALTTTKNRIDCDVEHSSAGNIADMIHWGKELGWTGVEDPRMETIIFTRTETNTP